MLRSRPYLWKMPGRTWFAAALLFTSIGNIHSQIQAYLSTDQFWNASNGNVIEVNLSIAGNSLEYAKTDDAHQANIEVLVIVERDGEIVDFKKTDLLSPLHKDDRRPDLIHQERFALAPGSYDLSVELQDLHAPDAEAGVLSKRFVVADKGNGPWFSDIQLAELIAPAVDEKQSRFGFKIVPYVSTYYPPGLSRLKFYLELYNTVSDSESESDLLLTYAIKEYESKAVVGNYKQIKRAKGAEIIPIMAEFDISDLASGNYTLHIEALDRSGEVIAAQSQFFQRNNPIQYDLESMNKISTQGTFVDKITQTDTLLAFVHCLRPIADDMERKIIDDREADRNEELMRSFFYSFWYNRNPSKAEEAWDSYRKEVIKVNKLYGTRIKQGYQTDRGYVHLKYGAPNTITDRPNETDAYPYQIWHYYKAGRFNDKRFVFYLPDLVTNDYELLHSEVPGEIKNMRWNEFLHARNNSLDGVQRRDLNSPSGERVDEYFQMPR